MSIDESRLTELLRVSPVMPVPALNDLGKPDPNEWTPTSITTEGWGSFFVLFDGVDVTYLRDVPCILESLTYAEPFGDETAVIRFPQISPFEALGSGDLAPFADTVSVHIGRVIGSAGTSVNGDFLGEGAVDPDWHWDGLWTSEDVHADEKSVGTTFNCIGTLYEADLRVAKPSLSTIQLETLSSRIWDALSGDTSGDVFRFDPPVMPADIPNPGDFGFGPQVPDPAAYQPLLTGLVQDLLALSYDPTTGVQWTVTNDGTAALMVLKDMATVHWTLSVGTQGLSLDLSRDIMMSPNVVYGNGQDPDGCEWRNAFYPGLVNGELFAGRLYGSYIAPLAYESEVEPYLSNPDGTVAGANPAFDPDVLRIERYEAFGQLTKAEATTSAEEELAREADPGWVGRMRLRIDPEEGSRWNIKQGQNVLLKGFRGTDLLLHIAHVGAATTEGVVTLTVDTKARDLPTLGAVLDRRRDNNDLVRRNRPTRNSSRIVNDRTVVWDCESGAGIIPATAVPDLGWAVVRIPAGARGDIRAIELTASAPCELAVGIFDRLITTTELDAAGTPADADFWDWDTWPDTSGLVQAVGAGDDLAGYGAMSAADEDAVMDGTLWNDQAFPYVSQAPPWLWVAIWATDAVTVSGKLYPGPQAAS